MSKRPYFREYGATTACVIRMVQGSVNCGQRPDDSIRNLYYGDSWFASLKTAKCCSEICESEFIGIVKTAHRGFPKLTWKARCKLGHRVHTSFCKILRIAGSIMQLATSTVVGKLFVSLLQKKQDTHFQENHMLPNGLTQTIQFVFVQLIALTLFLTFSNIPIKLTNTITPASRS